MALLAITFVLSAPTAAMAASRPCDAASDASSQVAAARRAANAEAGRYMAALSAFEGLKAKAAGVEAAITSGEQRATTLRRIVQKRAARAYMRAGSSLPSLLSIGDVTDMMRSDKLLDHREPGRHRRAVVAQRAARGPAGAARRPAQPRSAAGQRARRAAAREQARRTRCSRPPRATQADIQSRLAAQAAVEARDADVASTRSTHHADRVGVAPRPRPRRRGGGGGGGGNGDAFLACVRQRESRGNYGVINPAGPWYGAYQFLASTWNITARHAGRLDLVGVLPSNASPGDQDAMAWHLYQWQGSGPWGGSC